MRENRNQWMMLYSALMARCHFRAVCMAFLRKSHTHDRVGLWLVQTNTSLSTPNDEFATHC